MNLSATKREKVLEFCAEEKLFAPPVPNQDSLAASSRCAGSGGGCSGSDERQWLKNGGPQLAKTGLGGRR